jgi:hypothetical protein
MVPPMAGMINKIVDAMKPWVASIAEPTKYKANMFIK